MLPLLPNLIMCLALSAAAGPGCGDTAEKPVAQPIAKKVVPINGASYQRPESSTEDAQIIYVSEKSYQI